MMDLKKVIIAVLTCSALLLFAQCEQEDVNVSDASTAIAKKPETPPGQDKPDVPDKTEYVYATVTGDVYGEGFFSEGGPFTLTLTAGTFDEWDAGTFEVEGFFGEDRNLLDDDRVRILYTTKKNGENRLDLWYTDQGHNYYFDDNGTRVYTEGPVNKYFMIRQPNPSNAYDGNNTLTFDGVETECIVAIRDGTGEHFTRYFGVSAVVTFSCDPE